MKGALSSTMEHGNMCATDKYPTCYDLKPIVIKSARSSVTDIELAALRGVDLAERINEPLNRFDLARASVRLVARIARKFRR